MHPEIHRAHSVRTVPTHHSLHRWVTTVTYLPDGRILSGGMDSTLWLWPRNSSRGTALKAHSGAVSQASAQRSAANRKRLIDAADIDAAD